MAEYIEREKLGIGRCNPEIFEDKGYAKGWNAAIDIIQSAPTADVRPVVLCKDCAHCRKGKASLECEKHIYAWNNLNRWVDEDDFCSWGVKREEQT